MVDINSTISFPYFLFRGLNLRDDENQLPIGETPEAFNFEVVRRTGLQKRLGWTQTLAFPEGSNKHEFFNYTDIFNRHTYITVDYPYVIRVDPKNGFQTVIYSSWTAMPGKPFFIETNQGWGFLIDGNNIPLRIEGNVVTTQTWPLTYVNANSQIDESYLTASTNPTALAQDFPSFGEFYKNRLWYAGDEKFPYRIYASAIWDYMNFQSNGTLDINVPFYFDVPCKSPITAIKVISNESLVIYCERELFLLTGDFPPVNGFPGPAFNIVPLFTDDGHTSVGCLGPKLLASRGNNDHFFVANNGKVYQLTLTDNFQQVKPIGLTDKIFPLVQNLDSKTLKRGRIINDSLKGELLFFVPDQNYRRYPNQCLILNYADQQDQEPEWSVNKKFGNFRLRGALIDRTTGRLLLLNEDSILDANEGTSYDGTAIDMVYQLTTLDFDAPDNNKEITHIDIYAKTSTGATVELYHLWENGQSGMVRVDIPASMSSVWGSGVWGTASWTATAGEPFQKVSAPISNRIGKRIKVRIRHNSDSESLFVHSLLFRGKMLGKAD